MSQLPALVLKRAEERVGVREVRDLVTGKPLNKGNFISTWLKNVGLADGDPYCVAFVANVIHFVFAENSIPTDWPFGNTPPARGSTALYQWGKDNGRLLTGPTDNCVFVLKSRLIPGRFVHTGFVKRVNPDGSAYTVEANTNNSGSVDGDGVYLKLRTAADIARMRFLRIEP